MLLPLTTTIGTTTGTELNQLPITISNIQDQITNKVNVAGDTITGNIVMSANTTITLPTPSAGFTSLNAVNKAYVDALSVGVIWINPVIDPNLVNDSLNTPSITSTNEVYIVGSVPTGSWVGLAGHAVFWDGTTWIDILSRPVIIGDRFGVAIENGIVGGGLTGNTGSIATITNATPGAIEYSFILPIQNYSFFVNTSLSGHFGHAYTYNTNWVEFAGPTNVIDGIGLTYTGSVLNVNLGAGITELPSDEIGIDLYASGGLITTINGTTVDNSTTAKLSLSNVGVAGTYNNVTTDIHGRVYSGSTDVVLPHGLIKSAEFITTTTTLQELDSFNINLYRSAKYQIQITSGSSYHSSDIQILHNGIISYITETGVLFTDVSLVIFDTTIITGVVSLTILPTNANTTIKYIASYIKN